jgi:hypothetical protein
MKQDRFLTGILIGIAALIIIALAVFFTRKDNLVYIDDSAPTGVVQNYIVALHKHDYEKAYGYLADLKDKPTLQQFKESFFNSYISPSSTGVEVLTAEISDDLASVELSLIYNQRDPFSSGYRNVDHAQLIRQNGSWKIKQMPGNFWAYDWYQPTPQPVK